MRAIAKVALYFFLVIGFFGSLLPSSMHGKIILCTLYLSTLPTLADVLRKKKEAGRREIFLDTYLIFVFPVVTTIIGWVMRVGNPDALFVLFFPSLILTWKLTELSLIVRFRWYHLGIYMVLGYHLWEATGFFWWHAVSPPFHIFFPY